MQLLSLGRLSCLRAAAGWLAAAMLASMMPSFAGSEELPTQWGRLIAAFDPSLEEDLIVGASIALVENGGIRARHDYGFADRARGKPVDGNTIFHWASITKTLNAIAVMQLRDQGRLALEDPLTRHLPELRQVHNPFGSMDDITIRMVLEHSTGFQNPTWPYRRGEPWEPFEPTSWAQLVAMMPYQEVLFVPGSRFSYSNPSWIYAARTLEILTGDPWEAYVHKSLFAPLGMTRSYFGHTPHHLREQRSRRYVVKKDAAGQVIVVDEEGEFDPGITIPNGGWNAPLADAAAYVGFLTRSTTGDTGVEDLYHGVLRHATLEEMWEPRLPVSSPTTGPDHIGLGFFVAGERPPRIVGHTGSQGGFTSFLYFNPDTKRGIVAAFNTTNAIPSEGPKSYGRILKQALEVLH